MTTFQKHVLVETQNMKFSHTEQVGNNLCNIQTQNQEYFGLFQYTQYQMPVCNNSICMFQLTVHES